MFVPMAKLVGWKLLINTNPTREEFREAWKIIFEHYPEVCKIINFHGTGINIGFDVETPTAHYSHGGFGYHTEVPILANPEDLYYCGCGCPWGIDTTGTRYYKIDEYTGLPARWEKVEAIETVKYYIFNSKNKGTLKDHLKLIS